MIIPTEIMAAVRDGDTQMVEHFLDEGGRVNAVDARGMTLLLGSVRCSKVELCRVLLERGADPNETLHPDYNEKKNRLAVGGRLCCRWRGIKTTPGRGRRVVRKPKWQAISNPPRIRCMVDHAYIFQSSRRYRQ